MAIVQPCQSLAAFDLTPRVIKHAVVSVQLCVCRVVCQQICSVACSPRWGCHTKCGLNRRRIFNCIASRLNCSDNGFTQSAPLHCPGIEWKSVPGGRQPKSQKQRRSSFHILNIYGTRSCNLKLIFIGTKLFVMTWTKCFKKRENTFEWERRLWSNSLHPSQSLWKSWSQVQCLDVDPILIMMITVQIFPGGD